MAGPRRGSRIILYSYALIRVIKLLETKRNECETKFLIGIFFNVFFDTFLKVFPGRSITNSCEIAPKVFNNIIRHFLNKNDF